MKQGFSVGRTTHTAVLLRVLLPVRDFLRIFSLPFFGFGLLLLKHRLSVSRRSREGFCVQFAKSVGFPTGPSHGLGFYVGGMERYCIFVTFSS